jgi:hypothetical protein
MHETRGLSMLNGWYWISLCCGKPHSNMYRESWNTTVFRQRIVTKKIIVPQIATVKSLNLRADCPWVIPFVANAIHLRAVGQGVIPVVANRGIGARFATTE